MRWFPSKKGMFQIKFTSSSFPHLIPELKQISRALILVTNYKSTPPFIAFALAILTVTLCITSGVVNVTRFIKYARTSFSNNIRLIFNNSVIVMITHIIAFYLDFIRFFEEISSRLISSNLLCSNKSQ